MPGLEGGRQTLVVRQPDDVVDPVGPGDLDRAIGGAIVHDQPLDRVEARRARRGSSPSTRGRVASSSRHGIWMTSFIAGPW